MPTHLNLTFKSEAESCKLYAPHAHHYNWQMQQTVTSSQKGKPIFLSVATIGNKMLRIYMAHKERTFGRRAE